MKTTTATVYGALLQSFSFFNRPFKLVANTTLNERFAVQAGIAPGAGEMPFAGYLCIGNGGHKNVTGGDGQFYTSAYQHSPGDAGLFKHIPFALRDLTNDLTPEEQKKFGIRKVIPVKGVNKVAYYLRRLPEGVDDPAMWINTVNGNDVTAKPFIPTSDNLNPKPQDLDPTQTLTSSGQFLSVSTLVEIALNADEIKDIIEACRLLFDNDGYAIISEMGLCTGWDRVVSSSVGGNGVIEFKEVIACQIAAHLVTYHNLPMANNGIKEIMEVGTTEPMLLTTNLSV